MPDIYVNKFMRVLKKIAGDVEQSYLDLEKARHVGATDVETLQKSYESKLRELSKFVAGLYDLGILIKEDECEPTKELGGRKYWEPAMRGK